MVSKKVSWLSFLVIAAVGLRVSLWLGSLRLAPDSIDNDPILFLLGLADVLGRLAPPFLAGWIARRHGLLIGFFVGGASLLIISVYFYHFTLESYSLWGQAMGSGIEGAMAALAGQTLRSWRPPDSSLKPTPHRGAP